MNNPENMNIIKKLLILIFFTSCFFTSDSFAADFTIPNSSGEPIIIDISNLSLIQGIDVNVGEFADQPRPYRNEDTKSLVIFPPPASSSEKTIQISAGSSSVSKTVSYRSSPSGNLKISLLPDLQQARGGNSITKISDGRVVLIGGSKSLADAPIDTIEIFNPETGKNDFLKTPNDLNNAKLKIPRSQHTATYLGINEKPIGMISGPVEQILVVGGFSKDGLLQNTIEILEIKVGSLQGTSTLLSNKKSQLKKARIFHTASLLPDGRVLIIGGQGKINQNNLGALNSIEIYDPLAKSVQPLEFSLSVSRLLHSATTLQDGNILIAGGFTNEKQNEFGFGPATATSELIDVTNLAIRKVGALVNNQGVGGHSATLLTSGIVLIAGGNSDFFSASTNETVKGVSLGTIQFYNNQNETFNVVTNKVLGGNLELQSPRFLHKSVLLPSGALVIIGGLNIKPGLSTSDLIATPISVIEVIDPDLLNFSGGALAATLNSSIETSLGRILPSAILVTPKNKTQGFLSKTDSDNFVNSAIYFTGGFTNGSGKLPTKVSELIQIETNLGIEGRGITLIPEAVIKGSYLAELSVGLDKFSNVPSLKIEPQTINLSTSNNFTANIKVLSTNNQIILLKSEADPSSSIVVSPSLFQVGENISITRKDSSVQGVFEISFVSADPTKDFIGAKLKVNVSDTAKPFIATVPGFGVSLSNQEGSNSTKIQIKVFSQDGLKEFTSLPVTTPITATITDPSIANLGGTGISSVVGNLQTQFTVGAIKPGKTNINFSTTFPDILPVTLPLEISGTPTFSNTPIDIATLSDLINGGVEFSGVTKVDPTTISLEDLRLTNNTSLFPIYVPVNLTSSIDSSNQIGTFTIRPVFGVDLLTALPRTLVNKSGTGFREPSGIGSLAVAGIVPSDTTISPLAIIAFPDGLKSLSYDRDVTKNIDEKPGKLNQLTGVRDIKLFEFGTENKVPKIVAIKGSMVFVLDASDGEVETSSNLSGEGIELRLTKVDNNAAALVSVGQKGLDLVFPVTDSEPRVVNFSLPGNTKNVAVVEKIGNTTGPFAIACDGINTISIVNLLDVNDTIKTINTGSENEKISKIDYAGRFSVNGKLADVLVAVTERKILLFDLNNLVDIPAETTLEIKNQIHDLLVIDGISYLALGNGGILTVSIGSLVDKDNETKPEIAHFTKIKLSVIKSNGRQTTLTKPLNAKTLADSKPFLLSTGDGNDLTVIKVTP